MPGHDMSYVVIARLLNVAPPLVYGPFENILEAKKAARVLRQGGYIAQYAPLFPVSQLSRI